MIGMLEILPKRVLKVRDFWGQIVFTDPKNIISKALECLEITFRIYQNYHLLYL